MERHIVYIATNMPGTRCDQKDVDGARKSAISLPRVKCLETPLPGEPQKYFTPADTIGSIDTKDVSDFSKPVRKELLIPLTKRERELLTLAENGWSTQQIAKFKHRSETHVRTALGVARKKIYVQSAIKDQRQ
jgi:ATP/maltotriose-dependent transcriptional regulator MalT